MPRRASRRALRTCARHVGVAGIVNGSTKKEVDWWKNIPTESHFYIWSCMGYNQGSDSRDVSFGSEGSIFNGSESMKVEKSQPQMKTNEQIRYVHQNIPQHQQERGFYERAVGKRTGETPWISRDPRDVGLMGSCYIIPRSGPNSKPLFYSRAILDGEMMV